MLLRHHIGGVSIPPRQPLPKLPCVRHAPIMHTVHRRRPAMPISCNVSKTELSSGQLYRPSSALLRAVEPFSLLSKAALEAMVRMLSCKVISKGPKAQGIPVEAMRVYR